LRTNGVRIRSSSRGRPTSDPEEILDNEDADTDATLASSTENNLENKTVNSSSARSFLKEGVISSLTQPNFEAMASLTFLDTIRQTLLILISCVACIAFGAPIKQNSDASLSPLGSSPHTVPTVHLQMAAGVVLLSIAAAVVFWKVKPE